jgi:tetratricopeptide (TPR) repeat protein
VADEPGAEAAATNEEADADGTAQGASEDDTGSDKSGSDESDSQAPSSDSPKDADEYVNTDPDIPDHIRKMSGRERHLRAAKLRDLAGRLLRHDSYEKSEKWWRRAWKYDPKAPETAAGLARTLVHSGREEEGLAWGRHALDLSGGSGRYHAVMGELLFKTGDLEGAIESYEVAAQRKPDSPRIRRRLRNLRHARDN